MAAFAKFVSGLAAQAEVSDELLVILFALALDVIKELAALGNHFQESAAGGEILLVDQQVLGELEDPLGEQCHLIWGAAGVFFVDFIRREVDWLLFCFYAHFDKGWSQRSSPTRPRWAE